MSARDQRLALAEVVVGWGDGTAIPDLPGFLESATDAVRPLIEADLRERLAAAIEALACTEDHLDDTYKIVACGNHNGALHAAADIVRHRP